MTKHFWPATRLSIAALAVIVGGGYALLSLTHNAVASTATAACGPAKAHTVAVDSAARIYRVPAGRSFRGPAYAYYGCAAGSSHPLLLSGGQFPGSARDVQLRGAIAGLIVSRFGVDTGTSTLTVVDLARRQTLHTASTSYMVPRFEASLVTYVMTSSGNLAWSTVRSVGFGSSDGIVTIYRTIGAKMTILDHGARISAASLKLHGHTLRWIDGAKRRHAPLP